MGRHKAVPVDVEQLTEGVPSLGLKRIAYSVPEVAALFGIPERTVYDTVAQGHLRALRWGKTGRAIRILARDLVEWYERQQQARMEALPKAVYFDE